MLLLLFNLKITKIIKIDEPIESVYLKRPKMKGGGKNRRLGGKMSGKNFNMLFSIKYNKNLNNSYAKIKYSTLFL